MPDHLPTVERSLLKARWRMRDADTEQVQTVARQYDLPEVVARLLCARCVPGKDIEAFLYPTLREHFPDPFSLAGMEACAEYLARAVCDKRKIAVFGDFDVDGATSSALLYRFLKHVGTEARVYIPDRLSEGYGPNTEAFRTLKDEGAEVVVLLDCGTAAVETITAGKDMGLEIVVVDHHEPGGNLPPAAHVINPKRKDDASGLDMLAACGVTFLLCVALNAKLRDMKFYEENGIEEPPLKDWLDLVALGTVCDMVPLNGPNRLLVKTGFASLESGLNPGIKSLMQVSGIEGKISTYHAGFVLGPRINAGSRVHQSDLGAQLLCTDDPEEARNIAWTLNDCNDKRKALQAEMERAAIRQVEAQGLDQFPVIVVGEEGWHSGLSGLVAGRLKEKYGKPACVIAFAENAGGGMEGRGSGRSVPGIHIAQGFMDAYEEGLLEKGGGHAMAGGFTIMPEKLEGFVSFICAHVDKQASSQETTVETHIDSILSVRGARPDFVKIIENHIGPFGQEHPEPLFLFSNVRVHSADVVGSNHIRTLISDWEGGTRMKAMAFRALDTPVGEALLKAGTKPFHILGTIKLDTWNNQERVEIHIKDVAPAMVSAKDHETTAAGGRA